MASGKQKVVLTFQPLFLLLICCHYAGATVFLDSSVGMRQACPGETVTYTCTVNQGFLLEWIVEPFLSGSTRIRFTTTASPGNIVDCNDIATVQCEDFNFVATLTDFANSTIVMSTTLADITSTLTFTATSSLNGAVVQCRGSTADATPITNRTLNVAATTGPPSPPRTQTPFYTVYQHGRDNVTLTVQWQPPQYDGGAPVNYTITVSPGVGTFTTSGTSIMVAPVLYNVIHTVSIVATNCNGSSSVAMVIIPAIDNVKLFSNKERRFTCPGDQVLFTCQVLGSSYLEWSNPLITQPIRYAASDMPPENLNRDPFTASLINVSGTPLNANITSTLQVTASRMIMSDATTVMCLSNTLESEADNFTVAAIPTAPLEVAVERDEGSNIRVTWMPPENYELFDIDHYVINVTSPSGVEQMTISPGGNTNTMIPVNEIGRYTVNIAARSLCNETGDIASSPSPPILTMNQIIGIAVGGGAVIIILIILISVIICICYSKKGAKKHGKTGPTSSKNGEEMDEKL